jgi:RNA polymerase sigma-70 factor (ECF subfamily)
MAEPDQDHLTEQLLAAARGDRLALSVVVRALWPEIHRFCAVRVAPDVADDVAQQVFLRVTRSAPGFAGRSSARTWVYAIARNTCADAVRARVRRRDREVLTADEVVSDVAAAPAADDGLAVVALLDELDHDRREAFELTALVGASYAEAAEILDVPVGTVRSRVSRARRDLITLLAAADV